MKLPFTFSLKLIFRLVLPGFILTVGILPVIQSIHFKFNISLISVGDIFAICTILLGWFFVIFDMPIYMVVEGRRYWPDWLWKLMYKNEEKRLNKLHSIRCKYRQSDQTDKREERKYREAGVEMRNFPMDDSNDYFVIFPTRLGNLIHSFEHYPNRIYGMDSVFYWPRIWLTLDKDMRDEIDTQQATADSAVYSTVAMYACGFLYLLYALLENIPFTSNIICDGNSGISYIVLSVSFIVFGMLCYRTSLHIHVRFGGIFKALFDLYKDKVYFKDSLSEIAQLSNNHQLLYESQKKRFKAISRYLNFYKIRIDGVNLSVGNVIKKMGGE